MRLRRDDAIALGTIATVTGLSWLGSRFSTFRLFFAWPSGGTWSNTVAAFEWLLIVGFFGWYLRDSLFPRLTLYLHRHWKPHAEQSHEDTRRHTSSELISLERRLGERLDNIERLIRGAGGD